ncbi:Wzz/FepE/Etk N-terminal domain-containing protein [Dongia deserti]|uniref:Wzz/FepE/Etk N-terminal domain-containing protein n=1 Tax=Dongia deserti TaxID=2268030 RepID=UPI0013C3E5AB|nr:Wzz/FepE/Etk N-terminal domain-containing protein [Dongia deserti]
MSNAATMNQDDRLINIDVLGALRRRKWIGLAIAVLGVTATYTIVKIWPSTYQSIATILIEEPNVPPDLVKSTVSTYAQERLQIIQQRVMTSQNLYDVIKQFNLYPEEQLTAPRSALINKMRSNVELAVVSANLSGQQQPQRARQQPQASIAFTLAFADENQDLAQQVAGRLTDLYLAENDRTRQQKAAGTTQFLSEQAAKLYDDVQKLEKRLLEVRSKYNGSLPEQFNMNTQMLNQAQAQLTQNRADLQILTDKKSYLQSQLSTISPYTPMTANGRPATPQAQLMDLELQYSDLSTRYGSKHPDVVRLQRQIQVLKSQIGGVDTRALDQAKYSTLQAQLSDALQRYGEKHPDVQRLRRQVDEMKAQMAAAPAMSSFTRPQGPPDNPMYIQIQSQLADADAQIRGLNERSAALEANIEDLQKRILQTPAVEAEYNSLQNQHRVALERYQNFKDKEADAQVAENMEQQSKGETFSVIEPPMRPDLPARPNKNLLMAVGFFLTAMLAAAAMVAIDMLDPRIYEPKSLMVAFGEMPLATVPYIRTIDETRGRRLRMIGVASVAAILMAGVLAFSSIF